MLKTLIIASSNAGKAAELQEHLNKFSDQLDSESTFDLRFDLRLKPQNIEVEETATTFLANAHLKASQVAIATRSWSIADDSGLEVMALNGAPGIFSARYANSDSERIKRLLTDMEHQPNRLAQFVCAIAIADPNGDIKAEAVGICAGEIIDAPRGHSGFGYDPIFYVPEYQLTFAEMPPELKAQISHRAKAMEILKPQILQLFSRL
ncbi:non-canonical purine NTP pyrophosphatase, rdgB/HAM1 family [Synechococcus sp. PCC 7502]|uniref:RdgB/HAM1 family non-canonical purine NTP pyrophosphatase n=1 Tax=Synechococcus sp. PCC 7502 TaxID=1173263 RepID=UPI00029FAC63|nr:RdgB/HAM1 family non-canonical purine NTP pyrophosphatase [Synechococcus sp. PCC 7502]AFY72225.1 non-canonical purine NTP pyrophosphatase, rdgB/HAM1 family [Synechococcus sp. PCC 7502]